MQVARLLVVREERDVEMRVRGWELGGRRSEEAATAAASAAGGACAGGGGGALGRRSAPCSSDALIPPVRLVDRVRVAERRGEVAPSSLDGESGGGASDQWGLPPVALDGYRSRLYKCVGVKGDLNEGD